MGALGEQGLYNHMMQQIAGGLDMPVHNSIAYQSLAKYTPRDIAEWSDKMPLSTQSLLSCIHTGTIRYGQSAIYCLSALRAVAKVSS